MKYVQHTIKTTDGKFIGCCKEVEEILAMLGNKITKQEISGKTVEVVSDEIVPEGKGNKRITIVRVV